MLCIVKKVDRAMNRALEYLVMTMLAVMVLVVTAQLVFRWMHASIRWSEELSQYTMVWCAFLSGALCVRKGSMVGLDLIQMLLPAKVGRAVKVLVLVIQALLLAALTVVGAKLAVMYWGNTTPMLKWSMGLVYAAIPAGFSLMTLDSVFVLCENCVKGWGNKE